MLRQTGKRGKQEVYVNRELEQILYDEERMKPYRVGALMYCPANNKDVAAKIIEGSFQRPYSLSLCLEDAISDSAVAAAETALVQTICHLQKQQKETHFYMPNLFIRVREPEQIRRLSCLLQNAQGVIDGFVLPKFSTDNGKAYLDAVKQASDRAGRRLYVMPTLESGDIVNLRSRIDTLYTIKEFLDAAKAYVLNVRVGGNDFCKSFGVRRNFDETIYDIGVVANLLYDILGCFSADYVVSGPVWEYFGSPGGQWKTGLERELRLDKLNGFVGKTVIHPNQIQVVNQALKVDRDDLDDALSIMALAENDKVYVEKSVSGQRMNEYKTHFIWAEKVIRLAKIYGVNEKWSRREERIIPL